MGEITKKHSIYARINIKDHRYLEEKKYSRIPIQSIDRLLHDCVMEVINQEMDLDIKIYLINNCAFKTEMERWKGVVAKFTQQEILQVVRYCNGAGIKKGDLMRYCAHYIILRGKEV